MRVPYWVVAILFILLGTFATVEWAAYSGHCPEGYVPIFWWPWPPVLAIASFAVVLICYVSFCDGPS
jgi:hypothetical protein